jgi:hypothetical protein
LLLGSALFDLCHGFANNAGGDADGSLVKVSPQSSCLALQGCQLLLVLLALLGVLLDECMQALLVDLAPLARLCSIHFELLYGCAQGIDFSPIYAGGGR